MINITIEGCCSMSKMELAEFIGEKLKESGFGKVSITGEYDKDDYFDGMLVDESVEIKVIPIE